MRRVGFVFWARRYQAGAHSRCRRTANLSDFNHNRGGFLVFRGKISSGESLYLKWVSDNLCNLPRHNTDKVGRILIFVSLGGTWSSPSLGMMAKKHKSNAFPTWICLCTSVSGCWIPFLRQLLFSSSLQINLVDSRDVTSATIPGVEEGFQ